MKIGINLLLWTAAAGEEHLALLHPIKAWGYDGVELPMFAPDCSPWPAIAKVLDDEGLGRTVVTVVPPEANPISDDASVRQAGVENLQRCVDACAVLGAEVLVGPLYSPCGALVGRGRSPQEWDRAVTGLRAVAEHARQAGVRLAVEPLNRFETYFLNSDRDAAALVDAIGVPGVGYLFDTFHSNIEEKDVGAAIRATGSRIAHVHISENDRSTPGAGMVHWPEVFGALREAGYDDWLTIEAFGQAMPEVAAATSIWRRMFDTEEQLARDGLRFIRSMWEGRKLP